MIEHQFHIFNRRPAGAKARRGFDEIRLDFARNGAKIELFVLRQIAIFKNDLGEHLFLSAGRDDRSHFLSNVIEVSVFELSEVDDIVNLVRTVCNRIQRLEAFGLDGILSQREADGRADVHIGLLEQGFDELHRRGIDCRHGKAILRAIRAKRLEILGCGICLEQRVIEIFCQLCSGQIH